MEPCSATLTVWKLYFEKTLFDIIRADKLIKIHKIHIHQLSQDGYIISKTYWYTSYFLTSWEKYTGSIFTNTHRMEISFRKLTDIFRFGRTSWVKYKRSIFTNTHRIDTSFRKHTVRHLKTRQVENSTRLPYSPTLTRWTFYFRNSLIYIIWSDMQRKVHEIHIDQPRRMDISFRKQTDMHEYDSTSLEK